MKSIIFTLVIILSTSCISAQEVTLRKGMYKGKVQKGTYYKTDNALLKKFIGIWVSKHNNKIFKLRIYKEKTFFKRDSIYMDVLKGVYCFENKDCNFDNPNASLTRSNGSIEMYEKGKVEFMIKDIVNDKLANIDFEILENGTAKWVLFSRFSNRGKPKGYTIPEKMVLFKEE